MVKDEAPYLREWLVHHLLLGVDHFYIFNNESSDDLCRALEPFKEFYELIDWPGRVQQRPVYRDGLMRARGNTRWLAVIDADEFIIPQEGDRLDLSPFEDQVGICLHWKMFGSSGHPVKPPGLVMDNYVMRVPDSNPVCQHVKSLVRPECVCPNGGGIHSFSYTESRLAVDTGLTPCTGPLVSPVCYSRMAINHYWTKSRAEFGAKAARGRPDVADSEHQRKMSEMEDLDRAATVVDHSALRFSLRLTQSKYKELLR